MGSKRKKGRELLQFYQSTIGKKAVMSVTGLFLFLFIVGHMIGNFKIFQGIDPLSGRYKIDVYGEFLRTVGYPVFAYGELLWIARIGLLVCVVLHIASAVQLTLLRKKARPISYAKHSFDASTYASRTMWVGGILIACYVVYHVLHFTTGHVHHRFQSGEVYANVTSAFKICYVTGLYILTMAVLASHLYHGFWSAFQTLGVEKKRYRNLLRNLSRLIAVVIFLGYSAVPIAIWTGFIQGTKCAACH